MSTVLSFEAVVVVLCSFLMFWWWWERLCGSCELKLREIRDTVGCHNILVCRLRSPREEKLALVGTVSAFVFCVPIQIQAEVQVGRRSDVHVKTFLFYA